MRGLRSLDARRLCVLRGILLESLGAPVAAEEIASTFIVGVHVVLGRIRNLQLFAGYGAGDGLRGLGLGKRA